MNRKIKFSWNKKVKKDSDGFYRLTFDTYNGGNSIDIAKSLSKITGNKWVALGAFMDKACVATKVKPVNKFSFVAECSH